MPLHSPDGCAPDISASIVSYNTRDALRSCLRNLRRRAQEEGLLIEIAVADNGSRDGSAEMVEHEFPDVRLLRTGGNRGYGRANNLALADARAPFLLILNSDAEPAPGALSAMRKYLTEHPRAAACGAQLEGPDGTPQPSAGGEPNFLSLVIEQAGLDQIFPFTRRWNFQLAPHDALVRSGRVEPVEVAWLCGACFLARHAAWEEARGFDERYWMYMEDADLCARWRASGWSLALLPRARAVHEPGGSSASPSGRAEMIASLARGRMLFWRTHRLEPSPRVLRALFLLGAAGRALAWSLLALARPRSRAREKRRLFQSVYRYLKAT